MAFDHTDLNEGPGFRQVYAKVWFKAFDTKFYIILALLSINTTGDHLTKESVVLTCASQDLNQDIGDRQRKYNTTMLVPPVKYYLT